MMFLKMWIEGGGLSGQVLYINEAYILMVSFAAVSLLDSYLLIAPPMFNTKIGKIITN